MIWKSGNEYQISIQTCDENYSMRGRHADVGGILCYCRIYSNAGDLSFVEVTDNQI